VYLFKLGRAFNVLYYGRGFKRVGRCNSEYFGQKIIVNSDVFPARTIDLVYSR